MVTEILNDTTHTVHTHGLWSQIVGHFNGSLLNQLLQHSVDPSSIQQMIISTFKLNVSSLPYMDSSLPYIDLPLPYLDSPMPYMDILNSSLLDAYPGDKICAEEYPGSGWQDVEELNLTTSCR